MNRREAAEDIRAGGECDEARTWRDEFLELRERELDGVGICG